MLFGLQVVLGALILSECVYKLVDIGEQESAKAASSFISQFPPGLVSLQHIQSANMTVPHRYVAINAASLLEPAVLTPVCPFWNCCELAASLLGTYCGALADSPVQVHAGR